MKFLMHFLLYLSMLDQTYNTMYHFDPKKKIEEEEEERGTDIEAEVEEENGSDRVGWSDENNRFLFITN